MDRWIVVHPEDDLLAWTGKRWGSIDKRGFPNSSYQVPSFKSEKDAAEYATKFEFETAYAQENAAKA